MNVERLPAHVEVISSQQCNESDVTEEELNWMISRRPLAVTREKLVLDYGNTEAINMLAGFRDAGCAYLLGVLNWPGVGSRWRQFLDWQRQQPTAAAAAHCDPLATRAAFAGFARSLGRVQSYRALALTPDALGAIMHADNIFPTGVLGLEGEFSERERTLARVIETHGVRTVAVCRLYIAHLERLIGIDPSVSLHDDWQTTTCIAAAYASPEDCGPAGRKRVTLFQVTVPVVESLGWRLIDVAQRSAPVLGDSYDTHEKWFCFPSPAFAGAGGGDDDGDDDDDEGGFWFDATLQRTERYGFYGIPFLGKRLQRLLVFNSMGEIQDALAPFARHQEQLRRVDFESQIRQAHSRSEQERCQSGERLTEQRRAAALLVADRNLNQQNRKCRKLAFDHADDFGDLVRLGLYDGSRGEPRNFNEACHIEAAWVELYEFYRSNGEGPFSNMLRAHIAQLWEDGDEDFV